ncbi:MAG: GntR family transcriptional regulator [Acidimicrobiaceae bacterium]|nr:GntR family transcriptional regulator [Acidimicrobiaceae bacterium]
MRANPRGKQADQDIVELDSSSPEPLWSQLVQHLTRSLDTGEFRDGFPSEHELARRYQVSRHTVREGIRQLTEQGRLYSVQGKGTFVSPWQDYLFAARYSIAKEITRSGLVESSVVLAQTIVTLERDIPLLRANAGEEVFFVERVRKAGDEVVALNRSWFPKDLGLKLLGVDLSSGSVYEVLEAYCGVVITGGWEKIRASVPNESDRQLLELMESAPVLSLERAAYSAGNVVEWRESLVRDDRFYLVAQWGSEVWHGDRSDV